MANRFSRMKDAIGKIVIPKFRKKKRETSFVASKQWVDSSFLTDSVYQELDERNGVTHKLLNKLSNDRYDKFFEITSDNGEFLKKATVLNSNKSIKNAAGLGIKTKFLSARRSAMKYGYSIIFIGYRDGAASYEDPVTNPQEIMYLRLIEKPEIQNIILETDKNSENFGDVKYYELKSNFFEGGFEKILVHGSRVILVQNENSKHPQSISMLKPMYNWLNLFDDMTWSIGQTAFRYGSGFPVITVKGYSSMSDDAQKEWQEQWSRVSAMTGYVMSDQEKIEFIGANGKALRPKEFFDIGLSLIAISGDLPKALIEGVTAGQVTGSETNLKDYYSDISSKQTSQDEPLFDDIYGRLIETNQLPKAPYVIKWIPLFEQNAKEIAETDKLKAEALEVYKRTGIITAEIQADLDSGKLIRIDNPATAEEQPVEQPTDACANHKGQDPRSQGHKESDQTKIVISRPVPVVSKFSMPKYVRMEEAYFKELDKVFKNIEVSVIGVVKGFNADSSFKDDLQTNFKEMLRSINSVFIINDRDFRPIVNENIGNAVNEGILSSKNELRTEFKVPAASIKTKKDVVQAEHLGVVKNISSDIQKDIEVQLGIAALNPSQTFKEIEQLIKDSFSKQKGRLRMGVGNELNSGLNQGNLLGYEESGIVVGKEWVSIIDGVTTDTCLALNGEVVPIGEAFSSGDFAPPAADPPHPCRSSLRSITASEAPTIGLNITDSKIEVLKSGN